MTRRGFTLIELLVVISIIALLASVVMSAVQAARLKGQTARAKQDMLLFAKAVGISSGESYKTLMTMSANGGATVSNCSLCHAACNGAFDLRATTTGCYTEWNAVLSGVVSNSNGLITSLSGISRDPWGSPYLVDQNQGEGNNCLATNVDFIRSAGPDGLNGNGDDIQSPVQIPLPPRCP